MMRKTGESIEFSKAKALSDGESAVVLRLLKEFYAGSLNYTHELYRVIAI
jgi:hypothetical protein